MPKDLTIRILKDIRDEIRTTREEIRTTREELSARIDITNDRVDETNQRLTEVQVRLATEMVGVAGAVRELRDVLLEDRQLRRAVQNHEERITALERTRSAE